MNRRSFFKKIAIASSVIAGVSIAKEVEPVKVTIEELENLKTVVSNDHDMNKRLSREAIKAFDSEVKEAFTNSTKLAETIGREMGRRQDQMIIQAMLKNG